MPVRRTVRLRKPLNPRSRFPRQRWEKAYQKEAAPRLRSWSRKLLDELARRGVIEKFSAYLIENYKLEETQVTNLAFQPVKDLTRLQQLARQVISATALNLEPVVEKMTGQIFQAGSAHAFRHLGVEAIWSIDSPAYKQVLDKRLNLMEGVKDSQARSILTTLRDQVYENGGHPLDRKTLDAIKVTLDDSSEDRARLVARTETASIQSEAAKITYRENGVKRWTWIWSRSGYERHQPLDGETVEVGEPFSDGQIQPGDEPNCMCSIAPTVDADLLADLRADGVVTE
jgi:DNA-binding Lrp family transcriptional regulator